jgi:hypothetical protein
LKRFFSLHYHRRLKQHQSFAVRFAYWNFIINAIFTVVFIGPVMALIFIDTQLGNSVLWVAFLSVWALFATHAGGAIAAFAAIHASEANIREGGTDPKETDDEASSA